MKFTDIVQNLIDERGITRNKMLSDLQLGTGTFNTWEKRDTIPSGDILIKIAKYFGVSSDYLLGLTSSPNMDDCYKRIKALFKESQLSDLQLEKEIGLPRSTIYNWDNGRSKSYKSYIDKIGNFFGVSVDYLLNGEPSEQKKEVRSIKDQHPELIFYDDSQEPQIPRLEPTGKPKDQILTGDPSPKYFTPDAPLTSSSSADVEMRKQNEVEMLQLFRKLSTRDQIKEITRLELLQGK